MEAEYDNNQIPRPVRLTLVVFKDLSDKVEEASRELDLRAGHTCYDPADDEEELIWKPIPEPHEANICYDGR